MSRKDPLFALREITDLAKAGRVQFSRQVQRDLIEMNLSREQGKEIVAWLTEDEFHERWYGEATEKWWDVYLTLQALPDGRRVTLYVKLRIPVEPVVRQVYVTSIHT